MVRVHRGGYTVLELVIVLSICGFVLAIAVSRARAALDRLVVRTAAADVRSVLASARTLALAGHAAVAVDVDSVTGRLRVRRDAEVLLTREVGRAHGVRVGRSRDSLTYDAWGLGRGAANLSVTVRLRAAVETVFVSRMGRVR